MVTKADLMKDAADLARKEQDAECKRVVDAEARNREFDKRNCERAETLLDNELGQALRRWNLLKDFLGEPLRCVRMDASQVFKHSGTDVYELHDEEFSLGFYPNPNEKPVKILIEKLREAGFKAQVVTEQVENGHYGGDGDWKDEPGSHDAHYLEIDWS